MSNVLLAGVKFNWRGAYANNVGYANNDAVGFNNSSFAAIAGVSAVPPMVPIASPTGTRFAVTVSGTTFRFAETRPDGALSSSSLITTSTANPTLNLQRGATYIFDFSNVPSTLPFALRITATSATTGIARVTLTYLLTTTDSTPLTWLWATATGQADIIGIGRKPVAQI